jgi:prepilin-type N-terminal cleavage/methylation domain-containing protein
MTRCLDRPTNQKQKGFTLVELLVAMTIAAAIGLAAATAAYQLVRINSSSTNRQVAISQVENAIHYVSRDAQQAQIVIPQDASGAPLPEVYFAINYNLLDDPLVANDHHKLTFKWIAWNNTQNEVTYTLTDGILQKTVKINNILTSTSNVADHVSLATGSWSTDTKILILQIQSTVGIGATQASELRSIQINSRPAQ